MKYLKVDDKYMQKCNMLIDLALKGAGMNALPLTNEFMEYFNKNLVEEGAIIEASMARKEANKIANKAENIA